MYLKSLDIRGFKSFAEATHIEFTTGLNLIVGPNGCGKSNLVDAIRWVLGEQNVRNIRGQKLEDVIFAGTDQKKALSLASVSLTLDNSDQALPSPYTEIMVNRRVYRSEQSEFYLNQQPVRLKDINQLFYGTGVGRKGYAIIGQGEIENLLSARPHDIRLMLEEASGLIRYRYQKDEAAERLTATDRDLQRLQDIIGELENRLQDLKIKAEKASTHLAISNEQQTVHNLLLKSEWSVLKRDIEQVKENLSQQQQAVTDRAEEVQHLELEHNQLFADHQSLQKQLDIIKNQRYETVIQLNQMAAQRSIIIDKISGSGNRKEEILDEQQRLGEQGTKLGEELAAISHKLALQNEKLAIEKRQLQEAEQQWQQLAAGYRKTLQKLEVLRQEALNKAQEAAALRNRVGQANDEIIQLNNRLHQYDLEIEQRSQFLQGAKEQQERILEETRTKQSELQLFNDEYKKVQDELNTFIQQREQLEAQLNECRRHAVQAKHEIQSLQAIENNYSGYSETIKVLLKRQKKVNGFMNGLLGVVGELIKVPSGLETAIEVALGRGMENLIVKNETDARQGIELLKRERLGRATFLPLDLLKAEPLKPALTERLQKEPGVIGIASQLISYPEDAGLAITYLLGRIVIVDNLETGLRLLRSGRYNLRLVTQEGEVFLPQGAITGGKRENSASILKRKARLEDLNNDLLKLTADEETMQTQTQRLTEMEKDLREKAANWQQRGHDIDYRLNMLSEEHLQAANQLKQQNARIEEIKWQRRLLQQDIVKRQQEIDQREDELKTVAQTEEKMQNELTRCKEEADDLLRQVEVNQEKIHTQETVVLAAQQECDAINESYQQLAKLHQSVLFSSKSQAAKLQDLNQQTIQHQEHLQKIEKDMVDQETTQQQLTIEEKTIENKLQEFSAGAAALLTRLNSSRLELERLQEKSRQYELRLARQETEFQLFDQQLSEAEKESSLMILSEKRLRELRHKEAGLNARLEEIGPVDPGSVDEFKATSERYALLSTQHQDLTRARYSLTKLVRESEEVMQNRFGEFLQEADASFSRTFKEIFGGGEASLNLLDDGDDSGVELIVKMPGKKRQSLNMLSGGERALTCIALIFSLLRLKPVPFCLLDEIDAALDEVNLQRFAQYIRQLAEEIQFIIISHRQGTIEIAQTLYGVTMPQGGISKVLSMQMEESELMVG